jgi:hypothetical protein
MKGEIEERETIGLERKSRRTQRMIEEVNRSMVRGGNVEFYLKESIERQARQLDHAGDDLEPAVR